ncbi:small GTP-binding protein domain-containing protein [Terribacillus halophilus]|uniref:Small GTP-binding protein domain-containing protein n=1 Tax=Terribacillus halophilus TaxID=361279 RepID=A0A1G6MUF2_9BACI|nr:dynamin family protein [Terribacillus halophilus]SDC58615.1 small GTP-binding protein domain-containing protein [Terribacillus halophilus]
MRRTAETTELFSLSALYQFFETEKEGQYSKKALDLVEKAEKGTAFICFTGHFSAGKSSIINALLGNQVLPASPIPTSANIVTIQHGEPKVFAYAGNDTKYELPAPYRKETLDTYCRNKDIQRIEIHDDQTDLPYEIALMDTPGIDASDDADRLMTESALHLVDTMFYVTDYNHVQSEVNLLFLQQLSEQGQPFYLIINQIDKHRDQELSWTAFKNSVMKVFEQWHITPAGVYYTTLKDSGHEHNQLYAVKEKMDLLLKDREQLHKAGLERGRQRLITNYLQDKKQELDEKEAILKESLHQLDGTAADAAGNWREKQKAAEEDARETIQQTLKNANLMPFEVRDTAEKYLESTFPDFKVGLFGSKKKTAEERAKRRSMTEALIQQQIEKQLVWRLRDKLSDWARKHEVYTESVQVLLQDFAVTLPADLLEQHVQTGASMNGTYTLVYTAAVQDHIKRSFKKAAMHVVEAAIDTKKSTYQQVEKLEQQEKNKAAENMRIESEIHQLKLSYEELAKHIQQTGQHRDAESIEEARQVMVKRYQIKRNKEISDRSDTLTEKLEVETIEKENPTTELSPDKMAQHLGAAAAALQGVEGFQSAIDDLKNRQDKLIHQDYSLVLFGAFSAGKSSFANSLLGESLLPVSPNPTTASINMLKQATKRHPHQTVLVKWKTHKQIEADIESLSGKQLKLEEFLSESPAELVNDKRHQAFLQAVQAGYNGVHTKLGSEGTIPFEEFSDHVTKESLSCFIEQITVYLDNAFLNQGVTLIDTPGADSVNARHTDVTFQFMKHADAILFVTYYNHAFSKADEQVLQQLGKVKGALEKDNMFFIVNASDLAKDEEEINYVTSYVAANLANFQIRQPRLFALSSLLGLQEKQTSCQLDSGLEMLEKELYGFVRNELTEVIIQGARQELTRQYGQLQAYADAMDLDEEAKLQKGRQYKHEQYEVVEKARSYSQPVFKQAIIQRIEKQLHYVKERQLLEANDLFKQCFNPSLIKSSGASGKEEVARQIREFARLIQMQLEQEYRAVTIRVDRTVREQAERWRKGLEQAVQTVNESLSLAVSDSDELPETAPPESMVQFEQGTVARLQKLYRGPRAFFQGNEKEKLKDELLMLMEPILAEIVQGYTSAMEHHYDQIWKTAEERLQKQAAGQLASYYNGLLHALTDTSSRQQLQQAVDTFTALLQEKV